MNQQTNTDTKPTDAPPADLKADEVSSEDLASVFTTEEEGPKTLRVWIKEQPYNGRYGHAYRLNSVQDLPVEEARKLIKDGCAIPYSGISKENFGKIETQTLDVRKIGQGIKSAMVGNPPKK